MPEPQRRTGWRTSSRWPPAWRSRILLGTGAAYAATKQQKFEALQLKAQGKLLSCLSKNSAQMVLGKPDNSMGRTNSFQTTLDKLMKKETNVPFCNNGACRYIDNGDGTVSDLITGLQWEKKTTDGTAHDVSNLYTWSQGGSVSDGTAFTLFLYPLNGGTSEDEVTITGGFANHCDWRLPTIVELKSIVDFSANGCSPSGPGPCISSIFGPTAIEPGPTALHWTSTTWVNNLNDAFFVPFISGVPGAAPKTDGGHGRAVRGGL
jgi:hypothetical protein